MAGGRNYKLHYCNKSKERKETLKIQLFQKITKGRLFRFEGLRESKGIMFLDFVRDSLNFVLNMTEVSSLRFPPTYFHCY